MEEAILRIAKEDPLLVYKVAWDFLNPDLQAKIEPLVEKEIQEILGE